MLRRLGCISMVVVGLVALAANFFTPFKMPSPEIVLAAEHVFDIFGFPITNTILATWLTMLVLIIVSLLATRDMKLIPTGLQNVVEMVMEMFYNFVESIAGDKARQLFPLIATFFFFILISNWMGILPGFGSIGVWEEHNHHLVFIPFLRSANAHLSTTIALAVVSVAATQVFGFKMVGLPFLGRYFTFKSSPREEDSEAGGFARAVGKMGGFMERVGNAFAGILELVSEFIKILSFSFRLFGNIFAGEVLLIVVAFLAAFLASLPFMALELFVGLVQALIFSMLSLVNFMIATAHHD